MQELQNHSQSFQISKRNAMIDWTSKSWQDDIPIMSKSIHELGATLPI